MRNRREREESIKIKRKSRREKWEEKIDRDREQRKQSVEKYQIEKKMKG